MPSLQPSAPAIDRDLLHPSSNKAIAMNADGTWLSYSSTPTAGETGWQKPPNTLCFRIPPLRAPAWTGKWQDSLVTFE